MNPFSNLPTTPLPPAPPPSFHFVNQIKKSRLPLILNENLCKTKSKSREKKKISKKLWFIITRPNCALDRRTTWCLFNPGFQRQNFKLVTRKMDSLFKITVDSKYTLVQKKWPRQYFWKMRIARKRQILAKCGKNKKERSWTDFVAVWINWQVLS